MLIRKEAFVESRKSWKYLNPKNGVQCTCIVNTVRTYIITQFSKSRRRAMAFRNKYNFVFMDLKSFGQKS